MLTRPDRGYPFAQLTLSTLELSPVHKYDPQPPTPGPTPLAPTKMVKAIVKHWVWLTLCQLTNNQLCFLGVGPTTPCETYLQSRVHLSIGHLQQTHVSFADGKLLLFSVAQWQERN